LSGKIQYAGFMNYIQQNVEKERLQSIFVLPESLQNYSLFNVVIKPIEENIALSRKERAKHDLDIINSNIDRFNREAEENLLFQAEF